MNKSKSSISLFTIVAVLFTIGFAPYLTQDAFALAPTISSYVADDPDNLDEVYSNGDTITITLSAASNATAQIVQDSAITGNFTFTNGDPLTGGAAFVGEWISDSVLVITMTTIGTAISLGSSDVDVNGATNNIGPLLNNTDNTVMVVATNVVLSGDFGLVVALTSNGSGCDNCEAPTLGINSNAKRLVDNGFSYNGKSVDVERYFTPYPLVTVQTGKQNVAMFKIYDDKGPDFISHFELAFGLANGESIGMSKAVINWDKTFDGIETVTLDDPENVLDKIKVTTTEGYCSDDSSQKCLIVKVVHTFRAPLDFNILGTNVWDTKRNAWQNYYNHGIEVVGESLNPPKEYDGINKGQIYHLTETGKTTAVDEFGNSWSLEYGQWAMDYIQNEKIIDGLSQNGIDRNNAWFNVYKQGQELLANEVLEQYCPSCSDKEFVEINDIFSYEFPKQMDKLSDSEIQNKMLQESIIAENTLQQIFDSLYKNYHH